MKKTSYKARHFYNSNKISKIGTLKEDKDPKVVLGFNCIGPEGYGEIIGASEEADLGIKKRYQMMEKIQLYEFYLDTEKGVCSTCWFWPSVERLIAYIISDNIKDTTFQEQWLDTSQINFVYYWNIFKHYDYSYNYIN